MPKSQNKSIVKKTVKSKTIETDPIPSTASNSSSNIESYVPKITHWTKAKKEKEEMKDLEMVGKNVVQDSDLAVDDISDLKPKNTAKTTKEMVVPEVKIDKLAELKAKTESVNKTELIQKSKNDIKSALPSFLNRNIKNIEQPAKGNSALLNEPKQPKPSDQDNSLTSIFKRDQDEISNIKRVFRKSIMFLTISLLSFGLSSLASSSFVFQSILALVFTGFGFIALTNIFFIIVAHRTYIWLFLIGQFIILSITQYPFSTSPSTLAIGFVTVLLTYLAYLDLEKVQLGSRLFSIPYIVGESTKILSSVLIFIVCLSSFNQINAKGLDRFLGESILSVPVVMDRAVLPLYQNVIVKESALNISDKGNETVKSLICAERKIVCNSKNNTVLAKEEYSKIDKQCQDSNTSEADCLAKKSTAEQAVLTTYLEQDLPKMGVTLTTRLDSTNYQPVLSQIIQNKIKKFTDPSKFAFLPSYAPASTLIPFIISLILFIILSIFKFVLVWIGYIVTWILWKLLQITGFVRLDIEMVEAEIVGI